VGGLRHTLLQHVCERRLAYLPRPDDSNHRVPSEHSAQHMQFSFALNHSFESTLKSRSPQPRFQGRESTPEYRRFLIIALGSLRETQGRYQRLRHWIPEEIVKQRTTLAEEIGRMITATIQKLGERGKR